MTTLHGNPSMAHDHAHAHGTQDDCCAPAPSSTAKTSPAEAESHGFGACCAHGSVDFDGTDPRYRRILWIVIAINATMFAVELAAGRLAGSQALQADALDFLADAATYGLSLAVIGLSLRVRATAALLKGASLVLMGTWVLGSTLWQLLVLGVPRAEVMGGVGFLALAANLVSVLLLMRWKDGDANVRSVWLCSRNDAVGNVAVMGAAVAVWALGAGWPDLIVAAAMAGLFLWSAQQILRQAWAEYGGRQPAFADGKPGEPS